MPMRINKEKLNAILRDVSIALLVCIFIVILFSKKIFIKIKSGEKGVLFSMLSGTQLDKVYGEGLHIINPLNTMFIYNVRVQKAEIEEVVLSNNGLRVTIKYAVLFKPNIDSLARLHQHLGPDYQNTLVKPQAESWTRKLIADLTPEEIFEMDKGVQERIETDSLMAALKKNDVIMEGYLIRVVQLPDTISAAIERKYNEEQFAEQYDYKLEVEEKERLRKQIEALGIRQFKDSSGGISALQWKALDVTQKIGTAPNSKVIIMGNSSRDLPVLLNDQIVSPRQN